MLKQMNKGVHILKDNFTLNDQHSPSAFYHQSKDIFILKTQEFREEYYEKKEFEVHCAKTKK